MLDIDIDRDSIDSGDDARDFTALFDLIEARGLFSPVEERVLNLVRLNRDLAGRLLLKRMDRFPISSVLRQLRIVRRLQLWYLHTLFTTLPDVYNTQEFAEYHTLQVQLYCEFAPPQPACLSADVDESESAFPYVPAIPSDLLIFLRASNFVPTDLVRR